MMLTKELETKINVWEADPNPNYNDRHIMDHIGTICANKGFMYVNIRKIIAPENEEIDNEVYTKFDNDVYLIIDFVTKGGDITEDMVKIAMDYIDSIDPNSYKLNDIDPASYVFSVVRKVDDPITLENLKMSTIKYALNATIAGTDAYLEATSISKVFDLIQMDHERGLYY